ncbi:carbonic anhydrase 9-like [Sardina pilchardus]|uniref:carbonic anhydrase 9-like n=1 Tax=Sardina pilchardus TaxID=27697 RepID=UPI002E131C9E
MESKAFLFILMWFRAAALNTSSIPVSSPDYCYIESWCDSYAWEVTFQYCRADFMLSQSPVNLDPFYMMWNMSMPPLELQDYDVPQTEPWVMKNIRDTVAVEFNPGMRLRGANFPGEYQTLYMSFHWGSTYMPGSEHTYNGRRYPMELQIIHILPPYTSVMEAVYLERQAVAILAFFIDIGHEDNPVFEIISSAVPTVPLAGDEAFLNPFALRDLLPDDISKFYRYQGSLTFPDCLFGVEWAVFEEPIYISLKQYDRFVSSVYYHEWEEGEEPKLQVMNYRHIHSLFMRVLEASPNASIPFTSAAPHTHSATHTHTHTALLAALGALLLTTAW